MKHAHTNTRPPEGPAAAPSPHMLNNNSNNNDNNENNDTNNGNNSNNSNNNSII